MVMTTAQVKDLLLPGLNAVFGEYDSLPQQWTEIFDKNTSEMYREVDVEVKLLGLGQLRNEGQSIAYEDMGERYQYVYIHKGVGLGFVMTRYAIRDNLYKSQFAPNTRALKASLQQTKEVYGAAVLNNAMDSTGTYYGGDSKPLLATDHPIDVGTVGNTFTVQAELNETSLQDAIVAIRRFKDAAGLRKLVTPRKMIVPPELQFVAERLLKTELRVGTADNDINALRSMGALPDGYRINDFLTNTKSWYIKTDCPDSLKFFQRDGLETDMFVDFDTDNLKVKATERYSFGWSNFRGIFGCMP
ncbi:Mu-like prophage major head subunit gpT family protein (plasmid) [Azospirillum sp. A26]|uniref:phage major capsid protein n=1 Tax=Azospirillum sp. A26 TaxID=3160607 RepID=UPI00367011AE